MLYLGHVNGNLYRMRIDGSSPATDTIEAFSGPEIDGRDWNSSLLAFSTEGSLLLSDNDAQFDFESVGSSSFKSFRKWEFPVVAGQVTNIRLTWDDPAAQLNVFLRDANGQLVDSDMHQSDGAQKWLSVEPGENEAGAYTVAVKIQQGSTAYKVSVNPAEEPPVAMADFEFSASGSDMLGQWQVFKFDVDAGDLIDASVVWDDPSAELRLFLRDESNTVIDRDIDGSGSAESVSGVAQTSGRWSVGVKIQKGSVDYDVLVNID
jgi:hypothetical protein